MKLYIKEKNYDESNEFPCLMAAEHFDKLQICLMTGKREGSNDYIGTNINGVGHSIGYYGGGWCGTSFKKYNGSVTISTKQI